MKKVFIGAFLILLLFTAYEIGVSYSLFETNNNFYTHTGIGEWNIEVNDKNVNSYNEFQITDFIYTEQAGVRTGKMAPGKTGTFTITIDPSTDVAFKYEFIIDKKDFTNDKFTISSIVDTTGNSFILSDRTRTVNSIGQVTMDRYTYTGLYSLSDLVNPQPRTLRITVEWVNDESNNETDSIWGVSGEQVSIPITMKFEQYLGETISVYTGPIN